MEERVVRVRVLPGAKKERIQKLGEDSWEIFVREPAQHNMANMRVRELVARQYGVVPARARLRTGHRSSKKTFVIML